MTEKEIIQKIYEVIKLVDCMQYNPSVDFNYLRAKGAYNIIKNQIEHIEVENEQLKQTLSKMETVEKELRARLENAVELHDIFNKGIIVILYDKDKIPYLYNAKVVGIGVDTYALYEGKIDIIMAALCENGDVHFLHGRQYKKKWFLREDRSEAEARLAELKGVRE